jgi:hypothetical protein
MEQFVEESGIITELWVECSGCGLRANLVQIDRSHGCRCETHWYVIPELTKRASPRGAPATTVAA